MTHFSAHTGALVFGLLGNVVSFMVFLAPLPTFYQVYKRKSTEGFQSIPYVVALFSAMLWIYYAFLKTNTLLLITINSVGCFIETAYILFYLFYAPKKARVQTVKVLFLLNGCGFGLIIILTMFVVKESKRAYVVGWICLIFALCVFVAPLGIVRRVIKTKSVEYMPFLLSFFLTLSAVMWFFYGLFIHDFNVAGPNVLGFTFGVIQMVLYVIYKDSKKLVINGKLPEIKSQVIILEEDRLHALTEQIINLVKLNGVVSVEKLGENENGGIEDVGNHNVAKQSVEVPLDNISHV